MDPEYREEKVYEVYLNITNPFDAENISDAMMDEIEKAARKAKKGTGNNADMWDKNNMEPDGIR